MGCGGVRAFVRPSVRSSATLASKTEFRNKWTISAADGGQKVGKKVAHQKWLRGAQSFVTCNSDRGRAP